MNESQELRTKMSELEQQRTKETLDGCIDVLDNLSQVSAYTGVQNVIKALVAYYGVRIER